MQHVDRSELVEKYKKVARRFDSTGLSIEESVVRLDALIEACSQLELGQSLLVMGHMGVGKTSFIKCLAAKFGPERTVFVENVPRGVCKDQVKRDVGLSECASFIAKSERAKSRSFLRWRSQKRDVSSWRERIKESGQSALAFLGDYITSSEIVRPVLVAIDYELPLKANPEAFKAVAELNDLSNLSFAIALNANPSLSNFIEEHAASFRRLYVPMLERDEIKTLIDSHLDGSGIEFDESAIDALNRFTGGRPYEVQIAASKLLFSAKRQFSPKTVYSASDVVALCDDAEFTSWDLHKAQTCLTAAFERFTVRQQGLVSEIVREGQLELTPDIEVLADELIEMGILRADQRDRSKWFLLIRGDFARTCLSEIPVIKFGNV